MRTCVVVAVLAAASLAGCSEEPGLAVHGDSTAVGSREGWSKLYNLAPSLDGKRWWNVLRRDYRDGSAVFNDGVGGQSISRMREKMMADRRHRTTPTIIYDRRNDGETADAYIKELELAVGSLDTDRFLILPQVPRSEGYPEKQEQAEAMAAIDRIVRARWPQNTFTEEEASAFIAALAPDSTRYDGLHRNATGEAVEARFIGDWLKRRNW